jgi:hypothetical protein
VRVYQFRHSGFLMKARNLIVKGYIVNEK